MSAGILLSVAFVLSVLAKADFGTPAFAQVPNYILTPKMHLQGAIKALQRGDNIGALFHLNEADKGSMYCNFLPG